MWIRQELWLFLTILNTASCARILAVYPMPSISHQVVFRALTVELARLGHELVVITPDPAFKGNPHPNVTEIDTHHVYEIWLQVLKDFNPKFGVYISTEDMLDTKVEATVFLEATFNNSQVNALLKDKNQKFDLVISEAIFYTPLMFAKIYDVPAILFSSFYASTDNLAIMGAPCWHPLLHPFFFRFKHQNLSIWEKVSETYIQLKYYYKVHEQFWQEKNLIAKVFGDENVTKAELTDRVELLLVNVNPIFDGNKPMPPNIVHLGGFHMKPIEDLPSDLKSYLDSSSRGVIYVSLGTNVRTEFMDPAMLQHFLKAFEALPYDVLWKYDGETLPWKPENLQTGKWFPQRDMLPHRRMRTVTNYFLVNLSFADLMMASLNCLFNFIYMLHSDWVYGVWYCQLSNFIANVTVSASVFTLTGISFDRYQAIVRPMRPRMSKTCSLIMIACIWAGGMLLAVPCLLYSTTKKYKFKGQMKTACLLAWPDGLPDVSYMDFIYQVLFFVVTYAVPMLGMTFFYSAMGRVLWGSRSIGELTQRQLDSIRSKRKVVKMFILVIIIFGCCWLPYHTYFIVTHFYPSILYKKYIQHVYLAFYWLAMANAMVNPIIYYWMNAKFRTYFRTAMCGWRMALRRRRRALPESPPDVASQSGSRSRSGYACTGIEEPRSSRGSVRSEWPHWSARTALAQPSQRPRSFASCPRCPKEGFDAYIHGTKA